MEPSELAEGLEACRPEAFEAVYRAHAKEVMDMLQRGVGYKTNSGPGVIRVQDAFFAEEICQETFAQFFNQCRRQRFDVTRPAKPYLLRIAAHLALQHLRKTTREIPDEEIELETAVEPSYERREGSRLLQEFLAELDERERDIFGQYFDEKRSQRAIAETLGMSRDQVYRLIVKIRKGAHAFFRKRGWFDEP